MDRRIAGLAVAVALLVPAGEAFGDPAAVAVAIEWRADDGCADAAALRPEIEARLRRNRLVDDDAAVIVRGASGRAGDRFAATIQVVRADGTELGRRRLARPGDDCGALDEALVVVLAMMVDSSMVGAAGGDLRPAPTPVPGPAIDDESPFTRRADTPPAPPGWRGALSAAAMAEIGRLPGGAVGLEVALEIEPPGWFPIELAGAGWSETAVEVDAGGSTFRQLGGSLVACPLAWRRRALACAGAQIGLIDARGFGFLDNRRERARFADARVELRGRLPLAPGWFLRAGVAAQIPLIRPRFSFENDSGAIERLFEPAPIAAIGQIGVGAHFR